MLKSRSSYWWLRATAAAMRSALHQVRDALELLGPTPSDAEPVAPVAPEEKWTDLLLLQASAAACFPGRVNAASFTPLESLRLGRAGAP